MLKGGPVDNIKRANEELEDLLRQSVGTSASDRLPGENSLTLRRQTGQGALRLQRARMHHKAHARCKRNL